MHLKLEKLKAVCSETLMNYKHLKKSPMKRKPFAICLKHKSLLPCAVSVYTMVLLWMTFAL